MVVVPAPAVGGKEEEGAVMTLFVEGKFTIHSGLELFEKIECDGLADGDITCLAQMILRRNPIGFYEAQGIPRGGLRLASMINDHLPSLARTMERG